MHGRQAGEAQHRDLVQGPASGVSAMRVLAPLPVSVLASVPVPVSVLVSVLASVLLLAVTVGCASETTPPVGAARGAPPPPSSAAPPSSAPPPPPTAPAAPAATTAPPAPALGAVGPSRAVAPPPTSRFASIRRDCGMTAPLSNGRTLWIYCDSALFGTDQRLQAFVNTSGAVATADAPTVMRDDVDPTDYPRAFLRAEGAYPACAAAEKQSLWPQSAVTIPASAQQPRDRVLIWYSNVCLVPGGAATYDIGLAEAWFDVGPDAPNAPAGVKILNGRLFPKLGSAGGYGVASVIDPPTRLDRAAGGPAAPADAADAAGAAGADVRAYVYWCGQTAEACTVARVAPQQAADAGAYTYFDGTGWVADAAAARTIVMGPSQTRIKASVRWVPGLERFVMVDVDSWNRIEVRVATRPEGPWSEAAGTLLPECAQGYPDNCFAAEVQPQLSGADHVAVSYFDPMRPFGRDATTRVVDVPVTIAAPR